MSERAEHSIDPFDYMFGQLQGLPDVVQSGQTIVRETAPLIGVTKTYIVQTIRRSQIGDTIFLECASGDRLIRLVLPPKVAATIARQRDALTKQAQRKHGKRIAQERKERGEAPAFMRARRR